MASMLLQHDQGRGPWILLHVVSGPWTSFVAALDKGQCRKAVCRRHRYIYIASKLGLVSDRESRVAVNVFSVRILRNIQKKMR
jgi:hypothetical protein